jgi:hypothetical protein
MRGVVALVLVLGGAGLCLAILGGVPMPWEHAAAATAATAGVTPGNSTSTPPSGGVTIPQPGQIGIGL